ncbi:glycosyltransferase [Sphingorhabdus arenilitoris]|uniref:Glycosyltransferase n=1 Tax=Sphingorhabdus arenilitoris TaxID=1490041 RepID=A0ABV8RJG4_9SPHN
MAQEFPKNTELPSIAVLMATYNGDRWLNEQLDSIFAQSDCDVQIFANDDGSSDTTLSILQRHRNASRIHITEDRQGGAGQNFLHLLRTANLGDFDYVALSDQDDIWMASKFARAISRLNDSSADAYSSNVTAFWPDGERKLIEKAQPLRKYDYMFESAGPGCTFVFTRETALAFQKFLKNCPSDKLKKVTLHDWIAYGWVRGTGRTWFIDNFSGLDYRQHDSNVLGASRSAGALANRWKMVSDGWYFEQALNNALLIGHSNVAATFLEKRKFADLVRTLLQMTQLRRRKSEALFVGFVLAYEYLRSKTGYR